jgi:hypothetical protein
VHAHRARIQREVFYDRSARQPAASKTLSASLTEIRQDPSHVIPLAGSDAVERAYQASTAEARGLNILGAPTFVTRGELFWGMIGLKMRSPGMRGGFGARPVDRAV